MNAHSSIVITRPFEDARILAKQWGESHCLIEPMLSLQKLPLTPLSFTPAAIILTSKHAVSALSTLPISLHTPIFTVGNKTAEKVIEAQFENVLYAEGNVASLISFIIQSFAPKKGTLLYLRGQTITSDLSARLRQEGFSIAEKTVYQMQPATQFSKDFLDALQNNQLKAVTFFSLHTLTNYIKLVKHYRLETWHPHIKALCISEKIAEAANALPWQEIKANPLLERLF